MPSNNKHHKDFEKKNLEKEVKDVPNEEENIKECSDKNEEKVDWEDKYKRALAEHANLLKSTAKEKEEFRQFAQIRFIEQILPVYDNLKISLVHSGEEKSNWVQGVEYVVKQFADTLKQIGVEEVETAGKKFSHDEMEAVSEEETEDKKLIDTVARQITCGYKFKDRIIKAARVVVYK